jgi:hypothetical protein
MTVCDELRRVFEICCLVATISASSSQSRLFHVLYLLKLQINCSICVQLNTILVVYTSKFKCKCSVQQKIFKFSSQILSPFPEQLSLHIASRLNLSAPLNVFERARNYVKSLCPGFT